ncbi:peptidyl-tRNA hydrolase PTH2-domain-containing protein [Peziza echinospora]|nr:peptidyl-tRNA hydrolase PTH2-domain-containing protein [Peziza echinospora]
MDVTQPITARPTILATIIATSILSFVTGYIICLGTSLGSVTHISKPSSSKSSSQSKSKSNSKSAADEGSEDESAAPDSDSDYASDSTSETATGTTPFSTISGECKLVLVVRTDLAMTKGKIAAQCGHAVLANYKSISKSSPGLLQRWERSGQAKIALKCDGGEEELELLQAQAQSLGLTAKVVRDAGRTQIAAGSATVLGIGPAPKAVIDQVTGHLKLL